MTFSAALSELARLRDDRTEMENEMASTMERASRSSRSLPERMRAFSGAMAIFFYALQHALAELQRSLHFHCPFLSGPSR